MQSLISYLNSENPAYEASEEVESAIALTLSLSSKESVVDELVKAQYPFLAFKTDEGDIIFDLLLLTETERNQTTTVDVKAAVNKLIDSKDDERKKKIQGCRSVITSQGFETFQIQGLIKDSRIQEYLRTAPSTEAGKPDLFKPQLTQKRFKSIKSKLSEKEKETTILLQEITKARENIETFIKSVEEQNQERLDSYIDDSNKKLDKLKKTNNKAVKKTEKSHRKDLKKLDKAYDFKANEIKEELEHIQKTQQEIEAGNWETRKRRFENELKTRQLSRQLENLEKERAKEIDELKENNRKTIKALNAQFLEAESNEKQNIDKLIEANKTDLENIKEISSILENLKTRVMKEQEYLTRLLSVKYKDGDLIYVPLYINKTDNHYQIHTPMKIEESNGLRKTLKLMLADSIQDKITQHIKPETDSLEKIIEKLIDHISDETKLQKEYKKKIEQNNILVSRSKLDKIEVGLYKLFEWEWINERDYMIAQKCLVEKMDTLNGGNHYQRKMDPILDTPPQQEIPA